MTSVSQRIQLTRQYLRHVHQTGLSAEVEPARCPVAEAADICQEHDRRRLHGELLAHEPEALRARHGLDHVLCVSPGQSLL